MNNLVPCAIKSTTMAEYSTRSSKAAINSSSCSDDDRDDAIIPAVSRRIRYNHKTISSAGDNISRRSVLDSSESEDNDQAGHNNQPRSINDVSSLLRMMLINLNQRVDANRPQLMTINRNRRPVVDYSDSSATDDEGLNMAHHNYCKIKHFSHPHSLNKYNIQEYSKTSCKVCGLLLVGSGYGCQSCQFYVHASCFDLPQKIQHDAHTAHPLILRYPSYYKHCVKTCDACCQDIKASFLYCCDLCHFDLHVTCATLYSIVKTADHHTSKDTLRLYYTFPVGGSNNNIIARCNVCNKRVSKEGWLYYSKNTGDIAHVKCAKGAKVGPAWIKERLNMLKIK